MSAETEQDKQIALLESYVLAPNKEAFLKTLVPNSNSHRFMLSIHEMNTKGYAVGHEAEEFLKYWKESSVPSRHTKEFALLMRHLLLCLQSKDNRRENKKTIDFIDRYTDNKISMLNSFTKPVIFAAGDEFREDRESGLSSKLVDQVSESIVLTKYLQRVYENPSELYASADKDLYYYLDFEKVAKKDPSLTESILTGVNNFANLKGIEQALELIYKYHVNVNKNKYFEFNEKVYTKCTKDQLLTLGKKIGCKSSHRYNNMLYRKTYDIDWAAIKDPLQVSQKLEKIIANAKTIFASSDIADEFIIVVKYCLLVNNLFLNKYDVKMFKEYVSRPAQTSGPFEYEFRSRYCCFISFIKKPVDFSFWSRNAKLPSHLVNYDSYKFIDKYISHILREENSPEWLNKYFDGNHLHKAKTLISLENGQELKGLDKYFTETELSKMRDQKYLTIEDFNKKKFEENEKVEIYMKIKNVGSVTIKTFEVNTQSYYRKYKSQFKEDIDLDGLIPSSIKKMDLSHVSPLTSVRKSFDFPEIQQKTRGIFIIEFIGGGLSSRAVIRKGGLTIISQPSSKGVIFNVVNERKEICIESTSILVSGKYYKADTSGDIFIPYALKPVTGDAVVIYKDFADIVPITVPSENYAFLTSLVFNEESLIAGNIAKLIIHPKVIFNGRAISISCVKNPKIIVNSTNDSGVKSTTVFTDIKYSYEEDTVVNYLVPARLKQIEVRAEGTITLVDGTNLNVSTTEFIEIAKKVGQDIYFDIYLQKVNGRHLLRLLGKNGEPLTNKVLVIKFTSRFIKNNHKVSCELKTDENGTIDLGSLNDITDIEVTFTNSGLQSCKWELNNKKDEMHIQNSYHICLGEELILPALGKELNKTTHRVCQYSKDDRLLMTDSFDKVSKSGNSFVLKFDKPGLYVFSYLDIGVDVDILVLSGQRWQNSGNFIVEKNQLTKMISDLSYMSIQNYSIDKEKKKLKMNIQSNNPSKLKVHVMGLNYYPGYFNYLHNISRKMCPHYARETFGFPYTENSYMSEKVLHDEINYVLTRKARQSYIGNTLEKPPILLKRHFNRDTNPDREVLQTGQDFKSKNLAQNEGAFMKADKAKLSMPPPRSHKVNKMSEFLATDGMILTNIHPNEKGEFEIDMPNLQSYSTLRVVASDVMSNISFDIPIDQGQPFMSDMRLAHSKKVGASYGANRFAQSLTEGKSIKLDDIQNTDTVIIDNLETVFEILKVISQYTDKRSAIELEKWKFLNQWNTLDFQQKMKYFDEFTSHELHVFLFFKDRAFFDAHVLKFISSKSRFDKLDHIFLGHEDKIRELAQFKQASHLTPIEMVMITLHFREKDPQLCKLLISNLEALVNSNAKENTLFKKYFDTVLSHKVSDKKEDEVIVQTTALANKRMDQENITYSPQAALRYAAPKPAGNIRAAYARAPVARRDSGTRMERALSICRADSRAMSVASCSEELDDDADIMDSCDHSIVHSVRKEKKKKALNRSRSYSDSCASSASDQLRRSMVREDFNNFSYNEEHVTKALVDDGIITEHHDANKKNIVQYKKIETTKEYIERNYYFTTHVSTSMYNSYWLYTVKGMFNEGLEYVNLDHNFILCCTGMSEILMVMAVLSLGFEKAVITSERKENELTINCSSGRLIQFCKQTNEKSEGKVDLEVIVSQRFYDPQDKYTYDEASPNISTLKKIDEFLVGKIYTSRVAVTNSSESTIELEIMAEVPQGSIPVNDLDYTKTYALTVAPLGTVIKEFNFYFPQPGQFSVFPATATKNNMLIGYASLPNEGLTVVTKKTKRGALESISEILVSGNKNDILTFMETKNIRNKKIFNLNDIYWLFKDEKFYLEAVDILRKRYIFDETTWAFSIYHGLKREFFEYLDHTQKYFNIKYLQLPGLKIDDFLIREYNPLTNPRTHNIGNKRHNIANKEFKDTYLEFLKYCLEKHELDNRDRLIMASYLILQDRIDESLSQMSGIVRDRTIANEELSVQLDYMTAYLSLYTEYPNFTTAKNISSKYIGYHVPTWRNRFIRVANQLSEFSGSTDMLETDDVVVNHEARISKTEQLKVERRGEAVVVRSRNIDHVTVSYYEIDIEILFSKDPFFNKDTTGSYSDILPTRRTVETLDSGVEEKESTISIPEDLRTKNMVIYVQTALLSEKVRYVPSEMNVVLATDAGFVKVTDKDRRPLAKIYVKSFALHKDGSAVFYKDGYTDMRGVFDYSSLNEDRMDVIEKFSILVSSPSLGSVTKVAPKPSKLTTVEDNEVLLNKDLRMEQQKQMGKNEVY